MGVVVAAYGVSHTAMIIRKFRPEDAVHRTVHEAFAKLRAEVASLSPDVIVVVSSEHLNSFRFDCFPQMCVGIGNTCTGLGDGGVAAAKIPLASDFAGMLLEEGVGAGFDLAFSVDPQLDHAFMTPLTLLRPEMDLPVVPVWQNASTEPLPPLWRAAQLGRLLAAVIAQRPKDERVLLVGAGGLSHWVGTPQMGAINVHFDTTFLNAVRGGDLETIVAMKSDDIRDEAGNGAPEIRNWLTVMAAHPGRGEVLTYEPMREWATGIAVARLGSEGNP